MTSLYDRKDRLLKENRHDVYQERSKWRENSQCTECGALYVNGRWTWQEAPPLISKTVCPACRRIVDRYPAGHLEIKGPFLAEHRDEILNLVRNVEIQEKNEHPLERIIAITTKTSYIRVTTTGTHVARRIGNALSHAYKGELSFQYANSDKIIRVFWQR